MKKKNTVFHDMIQPLIVLVLICLVVSALLGFTNSVTAPIVEQHKQEEAARVRKEVLGIDAGSEAAFTEIDCDTEALGIESAFREDSGRGYVVTARNKGYGDGGVTVTVGLDAEGKVIGLSADVTSETKGVGSKTGEKSFTDRFLGLTGNCDAIDGITGATYSSKAVKAGVNAALAAYAAIH
jgi:electron transport complex protein RnfG